MQLADVMQEIEQYRFASELNLAAGTKAFRRGLRNHELFRSLVNLAKEREAKAAVARRVEELAETIIDSQYENRYDAALSAYLTALADTADPELIAKAATAATRARNTWWTVGISHDLISHAVATGFARAPAAAHVIPASLPKRVQWHKEAIRTWLVHSEAVTSSLNNDLIHQILRAYGTASLSEQVTKASNVIVMPPPNEEGERLVWKARRRQHRKPASSIPHPRTRHIAHA